MDSFQAALPYSTQDGGVTAADASVYWTYNGGYEGGMLARRYNVVIRIVAASDNQFALDSYTLGTWAGWQVTKIESLAR